jgi:hypothetical protein
VTSPRWRRGLSTLRGIPLLPFRKLLRYDISPLDTPQRRARGLVLVLSGIEGYGPFAHSLALGLGDAVDGAVEVHEWTTRRLMSSLRHLVDLPRNRQQAALLAARIRQHQRDHPGAPVHLVGHSGGAAMAVMALEELARLEAPPVHTAVLLAAALAPAYDLTAALGQVERMVSFHSPLDVPHLVLGTLVFGTIDRRHAVGAGFGGFKPCDHEAYQRLEQRRYRPSMLRSWHWGGHLGWTNRVFVAEHVAPLLQRGARSSERGAFLRRSAHL